MTVDQTITRVFITDGSANAKVRELQTNAMLFLSDARALGLRPSAGAFVLAAHGIELTLKAYLHGKGETLEDLRKHYSHDLLRLYDAASVAGLTITKPETRAIIDRLNGALSNAAIRYEFNFQDLPMATVLTEVAQSLLDDSKR